MGGKGSGKPAGYGGFRKKPTAKVNEKHETFTNVSGHKKAQVNKSKMNGKTNSFNGKVFDAEYSSLEDFHKNAPTGQILEGGNGVYYTYTDELRSSVSKSEIKKLAKDYANADGKKVTYAKVNSWKGFNGSLHT